MRRTLILSISLLLLSLPAFAGWDEGVAAFSAGRYEEAEAEFRTFLEKSPEAADAYFMLGRTLQRQKRMDEAIAALGRAVELGDADRYWLAQSQAQLQAGRGDDALKTLAAQDPKALPDALRPPYGKLLAQAATQSSRAETALAALERAAASDSEAKHLQVARAEVARSLGRVRTEHEALVAAFDADPSDNALARQAFDVAVIAAQTNRGKADEWYRAAYEVARRWVESIPSAESYVAAGEALMGTKSYTEARGWFEKAEAEVEDGKSADPKLLYYLGTCHLADGQARAALERLEKALVGTKEPEPKLRQRILLDKGSALRHLEEFAKAAAVYREAGAAEKVAEMEGLVKAQEENAKWAAARLECLRKQQIIQETRASSADLKGTPEWEAAEADFSEILAACEPYLREGA